jgi:hypothetical protein
MAEQPNHVSTMEALLARLTSGGALSWRAVRSRAEVPERFFQVYQSWDYKPGRFTWENQDDIYRETRYRPRSSLSEVRTPSISFKGPIKDVVDFYGTSREFSFVSEQLFDLLTASDPGSIESLSVELRAQDGSLPFRAVLPTRSIAAIDVARTDIELRDQFKWARVVPTFDFPNGIVFNNELIGNVTKFCDLDTAGWYWSADVLQQAERAGLRGFYAVSKSRPRDREYIRL